MRKHFPQLDGLRGLASLVVLSRHYWPGFRFDPTEGRIGADLFFVLSGFLITRSLLRLRGQDQPWTAIRAFYCRRAVRIMPLYYGTLIVVALLGWDHFGRGLFWHAYFLSNFYFIWCGRYVGAAGHLWALAVEQQFYVFWPFCMLWPSPRRLLFYALGLMMLGLASHAAAGVFGWSKLVVNVMTPGTFECLGIGAVLAIVMVGRTESVRRTEGWVSALGLFGALLMISLIFVAPAHRWPILLGTELARACVLAWVVVQAICEIPGWIGRALASVPARLLGGWSYGIYLSHNFFLAWIGRLEWHGGFLPGRLVNTVLALIATMVCAGLYHSVIEPRLFKRSDSGTPLQRSGTFSSPSKAVP